MPVGIGGHIVAAAQGVLQRRSGESRASQHEPEADASPSRRDAYRYNAFISYSRAVDGKLAPALQSGLQRFAKPWYRMRALRVFRDDASLSANEALWPSITKALDQSEFFVLLASPEAAKSKWVNKEIAHWREHRPAGPVLIALTEGALVWEETRGDFIHSEESPVPAALKGAYREVPRWTDLTWARTEENLSLSDPRFRDGVADISATLHHLESKEDIVGEEVRQHLRTVRAVIATVVVLAALALAASLAALYARDQRNTARAERDLATSRYLAAQARSELDSALDRSLLLSAEAVDFDQSAEAKGALLEGLQRAVDSHVRAFLSGDADAVSAAFSPGDNDILASGNADGTIYLWDVVSGRRLGRPLAGHRGSVQALQFSPTDANVLVSSDTDGKVILWDVEGRVPHELPLRDQVDSVLSVAFSISGNTVAASAVDAGGNIGKIFRWSVSGRTRLGEPLYTHGLPAANLAFSPRSDSTLAAVIPDVQGDAIPVWNLSLRGRRAGVPRWRLPAYAVDHNVGGVSDLAFSRTGEVLALGGGNAFTEEGGKVGLIDITRNEPLGKPLVSPGASFVNDVAFSPTDDDILAIGSADGSITLWDVKRRERLGQPLAAWKHATQEVVFSPDGRTLASIHGNGTIVIWEVDRRELLGIPLAGRRESVSDLVFNSDGDTLAVSGDEDIGLWNVQRLRPLGRSVEGTGGFGTNIAFSPAGETLIQANGAGETVVLRDLQRDEVVGTLRTGGVTISDVAFSPDGNKLAGTSDQGTVILWDLEKRQRLATPFTNLRPGIQNVAWTPPLAFSADGRTFASAHEGGGIVLWDIPGKDRLGGQLPGHVKPVSGLMFSPDSERLASGSLDGTVILWDVDRRRDTARLTSPSEGWHSLAFSPNGELLASGGANGKTVLWDLERQQQLGGPLNGTGPLAFSPDGSKLASGTADGGVVLWDTSVASWTRRACAIAKRNLSQAEWDQFVGGPYERTCPNLPPGEGAPDNS